MTVSKLMTDEQLDELMTVAVKMQRDSEKEGDRPAAMFAYAVQVAVLELRKVRNDAATLAAENGQMLRLLTDVSENHLEYLSEGEDCMMAGVPLDYVSEINAYVSRDVEAENPFKKTDAFMAEVRASVIPEGYVLVPQQIFLEPADIESICSQCGDGHESGYGDFTDGLLWVGNIQRDDGSIVHGLHISSADYSEEGGVTVCEFAGQIRNEAKPCPHCGGTGTCSDSGCTATDQMIERNRNSKGVQS